MAVEVILPRVDMDMTEGRIARWHVGEGEAVTEGDALFEIETDKAAMEVEAPASGVVRGVDGRIDQPIPIGAVVAWICAEDEDAPAEAPPSAGNGMDASAEQPLAEEVGPSAEGGADAEAETVAAQKAAAGTRWDERSPAPEEVPSEELRPRATPLARRLAREHELDLTAIRGTGPRGRIQSGDVEAALREAEEEALVAEPQRPEAPSLETRRREAPASEAPRKPSARGPGTDAPARAPEEAGLKQLRDGQGEALLLLHGFGAEAAVWRGFANALPLPNPVWAVDLPAHGAAAPPAAPGFEALVAAVEDAVLDGRLGPMHLVGHSLGGAVAVMLAASGAVEARSLLMLAPAGLGGAIDGGFVRAVAEAETEAGLSAWLSRLVSDPGALPPSLARVTLRSRAEPGRREALATLGAGLFADGAQLFSIEPALRHVTVPARMVVGLADRIIAPEGARRAPPHVAVHLLPGVGHMPQNEAPGLVGRLLAETIRSAP